MLKTNTKRTLSLSLGALGIVYGDLGTSPLYSLQQVLPFIPRTVDNILGALSLVFWSLILVISTQYVIVFLRADNNGEGGILALVSLIKRQRQKFPRWLFLIGILGAGLLLGDGMITPAISVISAIEGLKIISPDFAYLITPISFIILLVLFLCQHYGTTRIGFSFGPILLCWFIIIATLGAIAIWHNPFVLRAINPYYALKFFHYGGWKSYILLSGIFLVITGAEAMYADLGHFGKNPIRISWFAVVLPSLLLNYFGQGAYLLQDPKAISNVFFMLAPSWFLYPLLIFATLATIIASQAIISASFSQAKQAILLNVSPRLTIIHTSKKEKGQVYVPQINLILGIGTLLLVCIFQSSNALASAYGIAVNLVMLIVATLVIAVARYMWKWSILKIVLTFSSLVIIELLFLGANLHKIFHGAWIPLAFAAVSGFIMLTWNKGIQLLRSSYYMNKAALPDIKQDLIKAKLKDLESLKTVFITDPYDQGYGSLLHYFKLNHIMPAKVLIVSIIVENYPSISDANMFRLKKIADNIYRLTLHYGFTQEVDIPHALSQAKKHKIFPFPMNLREISYLVEMINVTISQKKISRVLLLQKKLFIYLLHNSAFEIDFYNLPYDRTIAVGTYCKI